MSTHLCVSDEDQVVNNLNPYCGGGFKRESGKESLQGVQRLPYENADFAQVVVDMGIPPDWNPPRPGRRDQVASLKTIVKRLSSLILSPRIPH